MAAKDEDGNVNADGNPAEPTEMDQLLEEISNVLLSQAPPVHEVESNLGEKKETTDTSDSCSLEVDRSIQNISSDQETSNEQGTITNQLLAVSSTTSNVPLTSTSQPSSSDIINVETKSVPVDSGEDKRISPSGAPSMAIPLKNELIIKERGTKAPVKNHHPLPDDEDVTNAIDYTSSEFKKHFSLLAIESDDSKELSKIDLEAEHEQYGTHEPVNQPMPTRQSITTTTASSPGRSPSVPKTKTQRNLPQTQRNQQAMNLRQTQRNPRAMNLRQTQRNPRAMNPHYSQLQVPSWQYDNITRPPYLPPSALLPFQGGSNMAAHYGNMITSPYWRPEQNDSYNMPPQLDAFAAPYGTMVPSPFWRPEQNDIYHMPPYIVPIVPYPYGSAYRFGTWDGNNPENLRFGYEAGVSSNHWPSMQYHQGGDLNAWRPNQEHQQFWDDVSASVDQQNDRNDPSDQTQQRSRPRDN